MMTSLEAALHDAEIIVNTANASYTSAVLAAMRKTHASRNGSTRLFTRFPDKFAHDIRTAIRLLSESRVPILCFFPQHDLRAQGGCDDASTGRNPAKTACHSASPNRADAYPADFQGDVTLALIATIELMAGSRHDDLPPLSLSPGRAMCLSRLSSHGRQSGGFAAATDYIGVGFSS